ncbi:MAG: 50S ribosomal protein L17 [Acidimicrobiales bacterium]
MLGTPKKGRRFGGSAAHQKAMMGNMVASLVAAEYLVTTEAKAKALRPVAERVITQAAKGGVARQRNVVAFIRDRDMAHKLFEEIGPRYADRPGGYTRILKLGPRPGDNAPMARIELL